MTLAWSARWRAWLGWVLFLPGAWVLWVAFTVEGAWLLFFVAWVFLLPTFYFWAKWSQIRRRMRELEYQAETIGRATRAAAK